MRIGHGYDVHRFKADTPLILGGIHIPHTMGLEAHSDGDVLIHAICDAILGAAGRWDIGHHFPDNDMDYAGIDSRILLRRVIADIHQLGWQVANIDSTIIAQQPRLSPFIPQMRELLSEDMHLMIDAVNIKATTTEKLGFTGREEGIAAHAVVLLERDNTL
ncbi:2-C-methyl-D-erythritol 2,4-cyclodiphosphate synthase [Methylophaga frappieri]|uniref:2-C-methyl-D-erythritol 2,4-cyclodiphosphate synthase n=1 Tax=Methylophaga frappieri (strain ATCC BAA-2434 / DSM 25690 / JAM7) TaxID=754477 RepID=I1YEX2_METFJ|nr:2-C-methyl-D-erythritol 2,4-cyclodiphosphate synthase [Methylophaga frappieri]AFJ01465.1 2-C-methyl-D-erythritol 2,4-cyclodiphosphate synthase [Methylophaga frappieri]